MASIIILFILLSTSMMAVLGGRDDSGSDEKKAKWIQLPGKAVQISAKGAELYAVNRYRQVLRFQNEKWITMQNFAMHVAATANGWAWIARPTDYPNIFRINPATRGLDKPIDGYAQTLSALSEAVQIHVGGNNNVHKWNGQGTWFHFPAEDYNNMHVSIGDGEVVYKVDVNGDVYRLNPPTTWSKIEQPRHARYIDVQAADRIVMTDVDHHAWVFDGKDWVQLSGVECVQATINYRFVFCVDSKENIWKVKF